MTAGPLCTAKFPGPRRSCTGSVTPWSCSWPRSGPDGTLRPYVTLWVVGAGDDLYVRSAGGAERPWYRQVLVTGTGRVRAGGIERAVRFGDADAGVHDALDAVHHATYDRFGPGPVSQVTGPDARPVTVRLVRSAS